MSGIIYLDTMTFLSDVSTGVCNGSVCTLVRPNGPLPNLLHMDGMSSRHKSSFLFS